MLKGPLFYGKKYCVKQQERTKTRQITVVTQVRNQWPLVAWIAGNGDGEK